MLYIAFVVVCLGFAILLVLVYGLISLRAVLTARASAAWPTTTGTVTGSGVDVRRVTGTYTRPYVSYTYQVGVHTYRSRRLSFLAPGQFPVAATDPNVLRKQYPVGSPVQVHYDPARPDRATLVTGASVELWLGTVVLLGMAVALLGVGYLVLLT